MVDKLFLTEQRVDHLTEILGNQIEWSGFHPHCILTILNGGLPIAKRLVKRFNLPLYTVRISCYDGEVKRTEPIIETNDLSNLRGKRVLIIDDLIDSGRSVEIARDLLDKHKVAYKVGVLFQKPEASVRADYHSEQTTKWVVFPWEPQEP
jgi:hypoxanthine phosphoribosyltransferase